MQIPLTSKYLEDYCQHYHHSVEQFNNEEPKYGSKSYENQEAGSSAHKQGNGAPFVGEYFTEGEVRWTRGGESGGFVPAQPEGRKSVVHRHVLTVDDTDFSADLDPVWEVQTKRAHDGSEDR